MPLKALKSVTGCTSGIMKAEVILNLRNRDAICTCSIIFCAGIKGNYNTVRLPDKCASRSVSQTLQGKSQLQRRPLRSRLTWFRLQ